MPKFDWRHALAIFAGAFSPALIYYLNGHAFSPATIEAGIATGLVAGISAVFIVPNQNKEDSK